MKAPLLRVTTTVSEQRRRRRRERVRVREERGKIEREREKRGVKMGLKRRENYGDLQRVVWREDGVFWREGE